MKNLFSIFKQFGIKAFVLFISFNLFSCDDGNFNEILSNNSFEGGRSEFDIPVSSININAKDSIVSEKHVINGIHDFEQENYNTALDDFIIALSINKNVVAYMYLITFPEDFTQQIINKLEEQILIHPDDPRWPYYIGKVYFHHGMYENAAKSFEEAFALSNNEIYLSMRNDCVKQINN